MILLYLLVYISSCFVIEGILANLCNLKPETKLEYVMIAVWPISLSFVLVLALATYTAKRISK